jgi:hypothetical protein
VIASNNFTLPLLKAILLITKAEMLTDSRPKRATARPDGDARSLVREHQGLVRDLKTVEASFGSDMLMLAQSLKYLEKIMKNAKIKQYLERTLPETLLVAQELLHDAVVPMRLTQHESVHPSTRQRVIKLVCLPIQAPGQDEESLIYRPGYF